MILLSVVDVALFWIVLDLLSRLTSLYYHWESCIYPYNIPIDVVKIARMCANKATRVVYHRVGAKERIEVCGPTFIHWFIHSGLSLSLSLSLSQDRPGRAGPGGLARVAMRYICIFKRLTDINGGGGASKDFKTHLIIITVESLLHQLPTHRIHFRFLRCNWLREGVGYVKLMTLLT